MYHTLFRAWESDREVMAAIRNLSTLVCPGAAALLARTCSPGPAKQEESPTDANTLRFTSRRSATIASTFEVISFEWR